MKIGADLPGRQKIRPTSQRTGELQVSRGGGEGQVLSEGGKKTGVFSR